MTTKAKASAAEAAIAENPIDTINRKLSQAHAIVDLVSTLHGGDNGLCADTISNSLWIAKELIDEAREAVEQCVDGREEAAP